MDYHTQNTHQSVEDALRKGDVAKAALAQLLLAYAKAEDGGSVEWSDVDLAVEYAKEAMPGYYECILDEINFDDTQEQLRVRFKEEIEPAVIAQYGADDKFALNEAFNDWTDSLCKDGEISNYVYNNVTRTDD
jgi:hypothetical protein